MRAHFVTRWWAEVDDADEAVAIAQSIDSAFIAQITRWLNEQGLGQKDVQDVIGRTITIVEEIS